MGVWRIHSGGFWSSKGLIERLQGGIEAYRYVNSHFNFRYNRLIRSKVSRDYLRIAEEYKQNDDRINALKYLLKCVVTSPFNQPVPPLRSFLRMAAWATPKPVRRTIRLLLGLSRMGNKA